MSIWTGKLQGTGPRVQGSVPQPIGAHVEQRTIPNRGTGQPLGLRWRPTPSWGLVSAGGRRCTRVVRPGETRLMALKAMAPLMEVSEELHTPRKAERAIKEAERRPRPGPGKDQQTAVPDSKGASARARTLTWSRPRRGHRRRRARPGRFPPHYPPAETKESQAYHQSQKDRTNDLAARGWSAGPGCAVQLRLPVALVCQVLQWERWRRARYKGEMATSPSARKVSGEGRHDVNNLKALTLRPSLGASPSHDASDL